MALGEILGAGVSLIGGLLGSSAEKKAAKMNYEIAMQNLAWQKEQFNKMLEIALRQEKEGKLGYTDANGNQVKYVEGKGWVTVLSPEEQLRQELQRREEETQLGRDIPLKRKKMEENIAAQRREGGYADAILSEMMRTRQRRPEDIIGQRNLLSSEGINEGFDKAISQAMARSEASGSSNVGKLVAETGTARGDALRKAFMENEQGARDESYNEYSTKMGNLGNMYNTFQTRATAMPGVTYNPKDIEGNTANLMARAAGAGAQASGNLLNANARPAPQLNYQHPVQYGMANTFANLGASIGNMDFSGFNFGGNYNSGGGQQYAGNYFPAAPSGSSNRDDYTPWA